MLRNNKQIIVEQVIFIEQRKSDSSTIRRKVCGNGTIPRLDSNLHFRRNVKRNDEIMWYRGAWWFLSYIFSSDPTSFTWWQKKQADGKKIFTKRCSVERLGKWGQIKNAMRFVNLSLMQIRKKERWENIYRRRFSEGSCFHIIVTLE